MRAALRGAAGAEPATTAGGVHAVLDHASVQDCFFQGAAAPLALPGKPKIGRAPDISIFFCIAYLAIFYTGSVRVE